MISSFTTYFARDNDKSSFIGIFLNFFVLFKFGQLYIINFPNLLLYFLSFLLVNFKRLFFLNFFLNLIFCLRIDNSHLIFINRLLSFLFFNLFLALQLDFFNHVFFLLKFQKISIHKILLHHPNFFVNLI